MFDNESLREILSASMPKSSKKVGRISHDADTVYCHAEDDDHVMMWMPLAMWEDIKKSYEE